MAIDTGAVDRALGSIGTTFRLTRLYPPSHPAVLEAMRQITASLPALAALGTVEWKIGATGLLWHGQHLLPRNTQVAELAGLLFARGVRAIQVNPGVTPEHWLGLFGVAVGNVAPDDAVLGRIGVLLGKRASQRLSAARSMAEPAPAPPPPPPPPPIRRCLNRRRLLPPLRRPPPPRRRQCRAACSGEAGFRQTWKRAGRSRRSRRPPPLPSNGRPLNSCATSRPASWRCATLALSRRSCRVLIARCARFRIPTSRKPSGTRRGRLRTRLSWSAWWRASASRGCRRPSARIW